MYYITYTHAFNTYTHYCTYMIHSIRLRKYYTYTYTELHIRTRIHIQIFFFTLSFSVSLSVLLLAGKAVPVLPF